jgi:exopolyphosphatase/guanosine-5'-triphosphate,3'-diphosphate pyrophosphatase
MPMPLRGGVRYTCADAGWGAGYRVELGAAAGGRAHGRRLARRDRPDAHHALGRGFGAARLLQPEAIERTLRAVDEYLAQCRALRVERVVAVATAVVREAVNPDAILQPLRERLPDDAVLRVLSEADEARLSYLSVALDETLGVGAAQLAVLDIGGGSVEVALGQGAQVQAWRSFPVGAGRVREAYMPSDPPSPREVLAATRALDEAFAPMRELPQPDRVVSIGGTGVNLATLALGLTAFDPAQVHGVWFGDETPAALLERLLRLSDAERRALPGIEPDRAPCSMSARSSWNAPCSPCAAKRCKSVRGGCGTEILYEMQENTPIAAETPAP